MAGDEFASFLNHQASGLPLLRRDHAKSIITEMARSAFARILERAWDRDPELHIVAHGYAYAVPTGIGALRLFGWTFVGPWLRPALVDKNIDPDQHGRPIARELIDGFNTMLAELDAAHERFHYVDVRPLVGEADWRDELHPTSDGFGRVADAIRDRMRAIDGG